MAVGGRPPDRYRLPANAPIIRRHFVNDNDCRGRVFAQNVNQQLRHAPD
jgi:hypothetical protein